jgi:hypothetical protein
MTDDEIEHHMSNPQDMWLHGEGESATNACILAAGRKIFFQ